MNHPTASADKTVRIPVKLVTLAGDELPLGGFILVPEERLVLLERVAVAARDLVARRSDAVRDPSQSGKVQAAIEALDKGVGDLERVWDLPQ